MYYLVKTTNNIVMNKERAFEQTIWELFEQTGQVGLYNLFRAVEAEE